MHIDATPIQAFVSVMGVVTAILGVLGAVTVHRLRKLERREAADLPVAETAGATSVIVGVGGNFVVKPEGSGARPFS